MQRPLVTLPGAELYRGVHPDGSGFTMSTRHGLRPWVTTGPDSWFYGLSSAYEIQEWSEEGEPIRIMRILRDRRDMPGDVVAAWEENLRELPAQAANVWRAVPLPDRLPAHEEILLDRAGNLWMAEYRVLDEPPVWQVIDPDGRWLGAVTLPDGGRITEIGEDYVLGVWRDEMEVETVRMYGLIKP